MVYIDASIFLKVRQDIDMIKYLGDTPMLIIHNHDAFTGIAEYMGLKVVPQGKLKKDSVFIITEEGYGSYKKWEKINGF
jgi:hypothetical protein